MGNYVLDNGADMIDSVKGQAGDAPASQVAEGFAVPIGLTLDDLRDAATLINDWDWEMAYGTGIANDGPSSEIELVAKVYARLAAAAARNQENSKTGTIQN
jgi:hypothetical protein